MAHQVYPSTGDGQTIRLSCCIPFCRRTFRNDKKGTPWPVDSTVICGKHWRLGSALDRRRYSRLKRLQSRGLRHRHGKPVGEKIDEMLHWLFARIVKKATESAGGIG